LVADVDVIVVAVCVILVRRRRAPAARGDPFQPLLLVPRHGTGVPGGKGADDCLPEREYRSGI
jgi:hypothetical protein